MSKTEPVMVQHLVLECYDDGSIRYRPWHQSDTDAQERALVEADKLKDKTDRDNILHGLAVRTDDPMMIRIFQKYLGYIGTLTPTPERLML